ncbi:hypothetical protein ACFYQA_08705 [Streptomyces sp. NPDC005774]|uniref:hypothetical protein n=1 Tax=Streptomyces sp. NPDC005774 TaxID=3364728 RepID=UPI0036839390
MDEKLMPVRGDLLIVEDLMLLLMNDDGAPQAPGTLYYTLGAAVPTELTLLGRKGHPPDSHRPHASGRGAADHLAGVRL